MVIASLESAGLPSTSPSNTTMVSAPITSARSLVPATSRALDKAKRSTSSAGSFPVNPASSTSPGWTEKARPSRRRISRRRGDREANTNSGRTAPLHLTLDPSAAGKIGSTKKDDLALLEHMFRTKSRAGPVSCGKTITLTRRPAPHRPTRTGPVPPVPAKPTPRSDFGSLPSRFERPDPQPSSGPADGAGPRREAVFPGGCPHPSSGGEPLRGPWDRENPPERNFPERKRWIPPASERCDDHPPRTGKDPPPPLASPLRTGGRHLPSPLNP